MDEVSKLKYMNCTSFWSIISGSAEKPLIDLYIWHVTGDNLVFHSVRLCNRHGFASPIARPC